MPVFRLDDRLLFPPVELADDGLLAVGGDLSPQRLLLAYSQGIFPWYEAGQPILWHSPDPRMVLRTEELHVPRSLRKTLRQGRYRFTLDTAFPAVIAACAAARRRGQRGTWITPQMRKAYLELHRLGWAHSVEAWRDEKLAGGVYGVSLGGIFFGESMFARAADASKAAFVVLAEQLQRWAITLVDCQVFTPHLARFGASEWPRPAYLTALEQALAQPTRRGHWRFDPPATPRCTQASAR
jgi:leucyl/phenylalanyl-tRNA--protein transferase